MLPVWVRLFFAANLQNAEGEVRRVAQIVASLLAIGFLFDCRLDRVEADHFFVPSEHTFRHSLLQTARLILTVM